VVDDYYDPVAWLTRRVRRGPAKEKAVSPLLDATTATTVAATPVAKRGQGE